MSMEIDGIRPAVISEALREQLDEYLRFRHLFRNVYGFNLDAARLMELINGLDEVFSDLHQAIQEFSTFLGTIASGIQ
jgi:hypothetical protein